MLNLQAIAPELEGIEIIIDPAQLTKLSLDYYHFSPVLQPLLENKRAELVVRPINEEQILQIARTCVKHKIPLTVRGAGTGNYGQCIPLEGGIVLDTTQMTQILWLKPGMACVEPGVKMAAFDKQARAISWELRMVPSTYRTATIGGFVGGGSVGMGSINYGQLRDRGNVNAVRIVTLEEEPRIMILRGDEVQKVNHAYGTTGIITQLEIPLTPIHPWLDLIVTFDDLIKAVRFGQILADSDGIVKKLISIHAWPIPSYFVPLQDYLPEGKHCALLTISEVSLEALRALVKECGGELVELAKGTSLLEFCWNHTTLHARSKDISITYLQVFYFTVSKVEQMYKHFGDELSIHLEFLKSGGKAIPAGLPLFRYTTPQRLEEIIRYHEENGAFIANPHTYIMEDGGSKQIDWEQLEFKRAIDPNGLLNPGKMRGWQLS
jgi:FAD/FMN-containing dehydrogenase